MKKTKDNIKSTVKYLLNPTIEQEKHLKNLCFYATKLYNTDNYMRRKVWGETGKIPNVYEQKKILKNFVWFKLLPSQTAQEISFVLQQNYKSWFVLRKKDETSNPPRYRKKTELSSLRFYQQFKIIGDKIRISMSRQYSKENKIKFIDFEFCNWKKVEGTAKFCEILNIKGKWYAHIVYEIAERNPELNDKVLAVDLGIVNTAGTVDTEGNAKIYSGKQILAINHYYNKEISKLQTIVTKQNPNKHSSRAIRILEKKKSRQINQCLHTHSKHIIDDCLNKGIKTIVVGDVTDIRKSKEDKVCDVKIKSSKYIAGKNHGKVQNQKLHNWSFSKFTQQLEYKCRLVGIRFVRVNEAYTSQTCSICGTIKKSNRKYRGYYCCNKCGNKINADINGAKNILKKYLQDFMSRSIGNVALPSVSRIQNVVSCNVREAHAYS